MAAFVWLRQKGLAGKSSGVEGARRIRYRGDRTGRAFPAPEANAEIQANLDVRNLIHTHAYTTQKKIHSVFI